MSLAFKNMNIKLTYLLFMYCSLYKINVKANLH